MKRNGNLECERYNCYKKMATNASYCRQSQLIVVDQHQLVCVDRKAVFGGYMQHLYEKTTL